VNQMHRTCRQKNPSKPRRKRCLENPYPSATRPPLSPWPPLNCPTRPYLGPSPSLTRRRKSVRAAVGDNAASMCFGPVGSSLRLRLKPWLFQTGPNLGGAAQLEPAAHEEKPMCTMCPDAGHYAVVGEPTARLATSDTAGPGIENQSLRWQRQSTNVVAGTDFNFERECPSATGGWVGGGGARLLTVMASEWRRIFRPENTLTLLRFPSKTCNPVRRRPNYS